MKYVGYAWLLLAGLAVGSAVLSVLFFGLRELLHRLYGWSQRQREFRKSMRPFEAELRALRDASEGPH